MKFSPQTFKKERRRGSGWEEKKHAGEEEKAKQIRVVKVKKVMTAHDSECYDHLTEWTGFFAATGRTCQSRFQRPFLLAQSSSCSFFL